MSITRMSEVPSFGSRYGHIEQSPATVVLFAGWRSTLLELQCSGWQICSDYNPRTREHHILINNDALTLCGISDEIHIREFLDRGLNAPTPELRIRSVSHNPQHTAMVYRGALRMQEHSLGFQEVDCMTEFVTVESLPKIMESGIFKYKSENQTMVDKADMEVVDMLEEIVSRQAHKQKQLRAKATQDSNSVDKGVSLLLVS